MLNGTGLGSYTLDMTRVTNPGGHSMAVDVKQQTLSRATSEMVAFETNLATRLRQERETVQTHAEVLAAMERFGAMVEAQRDRLVAYVESLGTREHSADSFAFGSGTGVSATLRHFGSAFSYGAMSYGVLYEMALRLYEPALREIAPKHLKAYVNAIATLNQLLPSVVAWELAQVGLQCACICPMCSIGACGCVAMGTQTLVTAWREVFTVESAPPGFGLQPPKPESQLARAGIRGGDRLLAVDGQEVRSVRDVQAAIRQHTLGDEVRLTVQRGSEPAGEFQVTHVSDYPKT